MLGAVVPVAPLVGILVLIAGCSSIDGYRVAHVTDENGVETGEIELQDVGGAPVVVQRPIKALFVATITTYEVQTVTTDEQGVVTMRPGGSQTEVTLSEEPIYVGPNEVYTVDPIRPFFGTLDYAIEYDKQFLSKIDGKIDDKTLSEVRGFVNDILDKYGPPGPGIRREAGQAQRRLVSTEVRLISVDLRTGEIQVTPI